MNLSRRIARLEGTQGKAVCPLCAQGMGTRFIVLAEPDEALDPLLYTCPICAAEPPEIRVIRIHFRDDPALSPQEREGRANLRKLMGVNGDGPRDRAVAELRARRERARGGCRVERGISLKEAV